MRIQTRIDKITNSVEDRETGISLETRILPIAMHELRTITKKNSWKFNWRVEALHKEKIVYKLITSDDPGRMGV